MNLPKPDFYIHDQVLDGTRNYVVRRTNPKPDVPSLGDNCLGLYTTRAVKEIVAKALERDGE